MSAVTRISSDLLVLILCLSEEVLTEVSTAINCCKFWTSNL